MFGAEFGVMRVSGTGIGPGEDIEIQWVDDAVAIAKAEGQRAGWDSVPWEDLPQGDARRRTAQRVKHPLLHSLV